MRSRITRIVLIGMGLMALFLHIRMRNDARLEDLRVQQAEQASHVTLHMTGDTAMEPPNWIDAPPPGSGLPYGNYMELVLPRLRLGEGISRYLTQPEPLGRGPMRSIFVCATERPSVVLYFGCERTTRVDVQRDREDVTLVFAKASQ